MDNYIIKYTWKFHLISYCICFICVGLFFYYVPHFLFIMNIYVHTIERLIVFPNSYLRISISRRPNNSIALQAVLKSMSKTTLFLNKFEFHLTFIESLMKIHFTYRLNYQYEKSQFILISIVFVTTFSLVRFYH
jgi:hypothetical protein